MVENSFSKTKIMESKLLDFYDQDYYLSHYGKIINDSGYYDKMSQFWKYNIFDQNLIATEGKKILDYGCGLGQVSAAVNADCFDTSDFAAYFLNNKNRTFFSEQEQIPHSHYDIILNSHSLEHYLQPGQSIELFSDLLKNNGLLVILLPVENSPGKPAFNQDNDKHFYTWNFQAISNLLIEKNFSIVSQRVIYGPFGLSKLHNISVITKLGALKKNFPSSLTVARKNQ